MESPPPSYQVVETVAREEGVSSTELSRPLHDVVDTDALDALFGRNSPPGTGRVQVTFEYSGYDVRVAGGGDTDVTVRVAPSTATRPEEASESGVESSEQLT